LQYLVFTEEDHPCEKTVGSVRGDDSMVDTKLLDILACPACRGDVEYNAKDEVLICVECSKKYPVKNGIPVMLLEESAQ
jgi:uncharacterized protein